MKKNIVFIMLVLTLAFSAVEVFGQTTLSGTYEYKSDSIYERSEITFTGNKFKYSEFYTSWSGTYSISGNRLTISIEIADGKEYKRIMIWTIVDANTLKDEDGDIYKKTGASSQSSTSNTQQQQPANADFQMNGTTLVKYKGNATNVTIPSNVTIIGNYAFKDNTSIYTVTLHSKITALGFGVFFGCKNLRSVNLPNGITIINSDTFRDCWNLTSVNIPNGVTKIDESAFEECASLTSITIPSSVTTIAYQAFQGCGLFESIIIPTSVTSIGSEAFRKCDNLKSVTLSRKTKIGNDVFPSTAKITYSD